MELNAQMNAHMNETLNIGGALLVKLFGRGREEETRFRERAAGVRDIGIRRAVVGSSFFIILGLVGAVGTALVYGLGGYYVITGAFTIGTIVAFGAYLDQLYGALQGLTGAPVSFSTSDGLFRACLRDHRPPARTSPKKKTHSSCRMSKGTLNLTTSPSTITWIRIKFLKDVKRYGRHEDVAAVLSLTKPVTDDGQKTKAKGGNGQSSTVNRQDENTASDSS